MNGTYIILSIVGGLICAIIASAKGRNAVGWFFLGFLVPLIGIIVICCVSNLKDERARYQRGLNERRRLREELKIERMKARQFRGATKRRLDIHDRALGVDTEAAAAGRALSSSSPGRIGAPSSGAPSSGSPSSGSPSSGSPSSGSPSFGPPPIRNSPVWYFAARGAERQGPVSLEDLALEFRNGRLSASDLVWREGWEDWRPVSEVPGLVRELEG